MSAQMRRLGKRRKSSLPKPNHRTFFSIEHIAKLQPSFSDKLQRSASINSDFPELGTPVTIASSPGTTCCGAAFVFSFRCDEWVSVRERCDAVSKKTTLRRCFLRTSAFSSESKKTHPIQVVEPLPPCRHARHVRLLVDPRRDDVAVEIGEAVMCFLLFFWSRWWV